MKILVPLAPENYVKLTGIQHPSQLDTSAWSWYKEVISEMADMDFLEHLRGQARTLKNAFS